MTLKDRLPRKTAAAERLVVQLAAAINARALYAAGHPRVLQAIESLRKSFVAASQERDGDEVTFLFVGDDVLLDHRPLRRGAYQQNLVQALRRRGVERLTFARGLHTQECEQFLGSLASGVSPVSTAHLIVGRVEIAALDEGEVPAGGEGVRAESGDSLARRRVESARESFVRLRRDRHGSLKPMDEIVWSMIDALSRSARQVLPLAALKEHDEYTFVHSVNVSLLVLAQGRSLGVQGPALHALGLAALLHDIGKLSIPLSILNKPGRLEDEEWKVMTSHAEVGAQTVCALEGAPPLAALVAYEHHLRYDGRPSYPLLRRPRPPNLASQLTSLGDTYDALCTVRPYQRARAGPAALEIIRERAGTFHDPFLAGNFVRLFGGSG